MVERVSKLKEPLNSGVGQRQAGGGFATIITTPSEFEKEFY